MATNQREYGTSGPQDGGFWTLWIGLGLGLLILLVLVIIAPSLFSSDDDNSEGAAETAQPADDAEAIDDVEEVEAIEEVEEAAATGEVADPIAAAAGTYWLAEESARRAVEATGGYDFESAEGAIVIEEDGSVSGDFSYVFWGPWEGGISRVTADTTVDPGAPAELAASEEGLTFDAGLVVQFFIEPPDQAPYSNPGTGYEVTGFVDAEEGLLELTQKDGSGGTSTFDFLR